MVDKNNVIPLYYQLKEDLRSMIQKGDWAPNMRIPSVREICEQNQISTTTAKQAIAELVHEGLLYSVQGKGTFVSIPLFSHTKWESTLISDEMRLATRIRSMGKEFKAVPVSFDIMGCPATIAELLQIDAGTSVFRIRRLKLIDKMPMLIETTYINEAACSGLEGKDMSRSLFRILNEEYGIVLKRSKEALTPVFLNVSNAALLEDEPGSLALVNERISYSSSPSPVLYARSIIRGDMCKLYVDLTNLRSIKDLALDSISD